MIHEIRNYHFEPTLFDAYKVWAKNEAMACLKRNLNVLGFQVNTDIEPEINGRAVSKNVSGGRAGYLRTECKFTESLT